MKRNSFIRSGGPVIRLKKLSDGICSVAFRLTLWYAGIFAVSLAGTLLAFYMLVLHGTHGISPHALSEVREAFGHYFGVPVAVIIALSAIVGWFMAKRALSGVDAVTRTAVDIANGALDRRVPVKGNRDEIDRLAVSFNHMVDRVQAVIKQMKEITENIAHDLRSPITRMRGIAELTLRDDNTADERAALAGTVIEECDRLLSMINTMLDISEAEAGLSMLQRQEIDLVKLLRDVCDLYEPLAKDRNITLTVDVPDTLILVGDRPKLQRVFANLLDNALKYTHKEGHVRISAATDGVFAEIAVEDSGEGIGEEDLAHIFDRFYRGEKSRPATGNGLGLSLARAFVLVHGGTITASSQIASGSRFTVRLPVTQHSAS